MCRLIEDFRAARICGVPLIAIESQDPTATIRRLMGTTTSPIVSWDLINGYRAINTEGNAALGGIAPCEGNVIAALSKMHDLPSSIVVFLLMADRFLSMPPVIQSISNLRDTFKASGRTLVLLGANVGATIPPELRRDVLQLDEPLPDDQQLGAIVDEIVESISDVLGSVAWDDDTKQRVIDSIRGLSGFEAEQVVAMAVGKNGISVTDCQRRKCKTIEQTKGLSVYTATKGFESLAGLDQVTRYLTGLMNGPLRPKVVVWLDEIEKSGLAHTNDMSGVNSDQLGTVLAYMEDHKAFGVMLVGVPGCGKSELCKAMAKQFNTVVIRLDMGALQGSLVGESQQQLRSALKVITAVCKENALFVATSNSIEGLDTALKSRFTDTFFFDLPTDKQRAQCWGIHMTAFGIEPQPIPDDRGWSGRNIQRCCMKAYALGISLKEASQYVIAEAISSRDEIKRLRDQATGTYLSSEYPGAYDATRKAVTPARKLSK